MSARSKLTAQTRRKRTLLTFFEKKDRQGRESHKNDPGGVERRSRETNERSTRISAIKKKGGRRSQWPGKTKGRSNRVHGQEEGR